MPSKNVVTPEFRVSYPNLFEPRLNDLNGKQEYSLVALFPKGADLAPLKKAANDLLVEKLGADKAKWPKNLRNPFRDQAEKEKEGKLPDGHEAGAIFINMKATQRPGIVDQNVQPIMDQTQVYAGCFGRAQVNPFYYNQKGNCGISFGLNNFQKTKDGDSLSGRVRAEDAFEPVAGAAGGDDNSDPFA